MATGPDIDAKFDKALRAYLRKQRASEDGCPDSAIVAAYFEHSLDEDEARDLEVHLARCASCQSELALLARLDDAATTPASGAPAHDSSPTSEAAVASATRQDEEPAVTGATEKRSAVELRSEQLEPVHGEAELEATDAEDGEPERDELASQPFVHIPPRSRWRWVAPTALAATAVIAVSVTYRFALDETSRRAFEPPAAKRANESESAEPLGRKQGPPAGIVEEPPARMEAAPAPPQHLDELAKSEPAPAPRQAPAPPESAPPQAGANAGAAGGAVAPAAPPVEQSAPLAEKKDAAPFAAKPSADARSEPAEARAKAAAPSAEDLARSALSTRSVLSDKERDAGEQAATAGAAPAAAEPSAAAAKGAAVQHGVIVVASRTNRLLEWRFGGAGIERSDDGGQTWQPQHSPAPAVILAASAPGGQVCWAVGNGGTVMRTLDGRNWQLLKAPTAADLVQASAWNESSVTVKSSDGHRFSTTDGAATWSRR